MVTIANTECHLTYSEKNKVASFLEDRGMSIKNSLRDLGTLNLESKQQLCFSLLQKLESKKEQYERKNTNKRFKV